MRRLRKKKSLRIGEEDIRGAESPTGHTRAEIVLSGEGAPYKRIVETKTVDRGLRRDGQLKTHVEM